MEQTQFKEKELPYADLEKIGLNRSQIEDLPVDEIRRVLNGEPSSVLPMSINLPDGSIYNTKGRIMFQRTDSGVTLFVVPCLSTTSITGISLNAMSKKMRGNHDSDEQSSSTAETKFTDKEIDSLLAGKAIFKMEHNPGEKAHAFYWQLDKTTKVPVRCPSHFMATNFRTVFGKIHLSGEQLTLLRSGSCVTIGDEYMQTTIGINLQDEYGIQISSGNSEDWLNKPNHQQEKYNFGINGCWIVKSSDEMVYVPSEEYDEKLRALEHSHAQSIAR